MWPVLSKLSVATLLLWTFSELTQAQVPFPHKCPEVQLLKEFDLESYMGVWYEYSKYPFSYEMGRICQYATYRLNDDGTVAVQNSALLEKTKEPSSTNGTASVIAPGQLNVVFNEKHRQDGANYIILGTDYKSWVVVYNCWNLPNDINKRVLWILTRQRRPSSETINAAKKVITNNGLELSPLVETEQSDCTEAEEETSFKK